MQGCLQVVVNLRAKKRLVSRIVGVGVHRIRFDSDHLDDITDAITRDNIRSLITAKTIRIKPIVGTSRGRAHGKRLQKRKRGTKQGSKKGRKGTRIGKKEIHISKIRALRYRLKVSKDRKEITNKEFWQLYKMAGGNTIRNVAHLRSLIDEIVSKRKS
jgi:large subunit ribosomal protein L19e